MRITTASLTLVLMACNFAKEPLRSGWLADGVYPQPPPPACAPVDPPGYSVDEMRRWPQPPDVDGHIDIELDVPFLGRATARSSGAGSRGPRHAVSTRASAPIRVLEPRAGRAQVPGFFGGVDLRGYRRVAFVADTSAPMCNGYQTCPETPWGFGPPAPALKAAGDQIDAAVAGMPADRFFVVVAGSAIREMRFAPMTAAGRTLAGQFVRGQVCTGNRGISNLFARALEDAPEAIVLVTDGHKMTREEIEYEDRWGGCRAYPNLLRCYVDERDEQVDVGRLARGRALPPVIAVTVVRHDSRWLRNLAEATGGAYVDAAR